MDEVKSKRLATQPHGSRSAGCFFKNAPASKIGTGKMIDEMGMKGQRRGSAVVSPVHANFIVTEGENARAEDALALAEEIRERVKREHGIELEYEVELWRADPSTDDTEENRKWRRSDMRETVVAQKVGNRSGIGKNRSATGQRPAKRGANESIGARFKSVLGYVPLALRISVIAIIGLIAFVGYRAAATASFFQIRTVETRGVSRASADEIKNARAPRGE